jgi:hypothetical protein
MAPRVLGPSPEVLGGPPSTRHPDQLAGNQPSRIKRQRQYRIVQTGIGLRRSHLRNAISLASMMFQLRPTVVPPTPPARHTQAEASDIPVASRAAVTTSVARVALIIDSPTHSPSEHISAPGRRSLSLMLTGTMDFRPPRQLCHTDCRPPRPFDLRSLPACCLTWPCRRSTCSCNCRRACLNASLIANVRSA